MEDWALIRRLHLSERVPMAQIARDLGISRNTVAKAVASAGPPGYSRPPVVTSFAPFEVQVRGLLEATPSMPATVLAERVGWSGSATWFRQNVARIRLDYARLIRLTGSSITRVIRCSAICGSPRCGSRSVPACWCCCRCW